MTVFRSNKDIIAYPNIRRCRIDSVTTVEYPQRLFPLLSMDDGYISVSINSYFMYLMKTLPASSQQSSFNHAITAICDFYDFYIAKYKGSPLSPNHFRSFLKDFGNSKRHGTIQSNGTDPTELYWTGVKRSTLKIYTQWINDYIEYLHTYHNTDDLNPIEIRIKSAFDRFIEEHPNNEGRKGLLYHLVASSYDNNKKESRAVDIAGRTVASDRGNQKINKVFPMDRAVELIESTSSIRNKMILLLTLFGGGPRGSELTHIFRDDVFWDSSTNNCMVIFDHPETGRTVSNPKINRASFINENFANLHLPDGHMLRSLKPRNCYINQTRTREKLFAGWKGMTFKNSPRGYFYDHMIHWLEPQASIYFWKLYITYCREYFDSNGKRHNPNSSLHPWLFVSDDNKGNNSTIPPGYPMTLKAIDGVFESACKRIGLPNPGKHSARHGYSFYAIKVKSVQPTMLSQMLRHGSLSSVEYYYQIDPMEITAYLGGKPVPKYKSIEFPSYWYDSSEVKIV